MCRPENWPLKTFRKWGWKMIPNLPRGSGNLSEKKIQTRSDSFPFIFHGFQKKRGFAIILRSFGSIQGCRIIWNPNYCIQNLMFLFKQHVLLMDNLVSDVDVLLMFFKIYIWFALICNNAIQSTSKISCFFQVNCGSWCFQVIFRVNKSLGP